MREIFCLGNIATLKPDSKKIDSKHCRGRKNEKKRRQNQSDILTIKLLYYKGRKRMSQEKSEKEKMLSGELYLAFSQELTEDRERAKELCEDLNATRGRERKKREIIIKQLFGQVGKNCWVESPFFCDYGYNIEVGDNFYSNHGCTILDCSRVKFGNGALLGPGVVIAAADHPRQATVRASGLELAAPIIVGDNCWIGGNATICPGVTLGNGVVVGAGAVVTKDMPDNVVCGGVPARILRKLEDGDKS